MRKEFCGYDFDFMMLRGSFALTNNGFLLRSDPCHFVLNVGAGALRNTFADIAAVDEHIHDIADKIGASIIVIEYFTPEPLRLSLAE